ncbi:2-amino-4-oxopentanoate thiolase subunit OrtB [Halanaerobaculum tunisiense]
MGGMSYTDLMSRKNDIMKQSLGIDYDKFETEGISFDYNKMMKQGSYPFDKIQELKRKTKVGNTPLYELKNINKAVKALSPEGKGARIFLKDEAASPSGSYKARRAFVSVYHAQQEGYEGVAAATSGNYGAAVASQANMRGLESIIVQEVFDSRGYGQPEILEKARKCETYGSEVLQLTVGPELFYTFLNVLEETGYFSASLYTPFAIAGVETLGYEIAEDVREVAGKDPDAVVVTNAGGGNLTGTARGLKKAGANDTEIIASSVDLSGLHMASDEDFNKKSFTTGHTGFGIPFSTFPDRSDVPRNAARALRYMDRYVTVSQGEVFYLTEALSQLEGMERGPAGNTSLATAFSLAQQMDEDEIVVVQETEYTGAGKHVTAQLTFAREENGVEIKKGNPKDQIPGENIIIPESPELINAEEIDLEKLKSSYIKHMINKNDVEQLSEVEVEFLAEEIKADTDFVIEALENLGLEV